MEKVWELEGLNSLKGKPKKVVCFKRNESKSADDLVRYFEKKWISLNEVRSLNVEEARK